MSRVFFPTTSLNRFGVRETDQRATLSGVSRFPAEPTPRSAMTPTGPLLGSVAQMTPEYVGFIRFPYPTVRTAGEFTASAAASPYPNGTMLQASGAEVDIMQGGVRRWIPNPATLTAMGLSWGAIQKISDAQWNAIPSGPPMPDLSAAPAQTVSSSGGGGAVTQPPIVTAVIPVSQQVGPTPTATLPAPPANNAILVSSGGGTQTPATSATVTAAPTSAGSLVDGIAAWLGGSTSLMNYNVPNALLAGVVVLGFAWLSSGSSGKKR